MRFLPVLVFTVIFPTLVFSQNEERPVYIGLDIFKSIPPLILQQDYPIQNALILEGVSRIGFAPRKSVNLTLGFTKAVRDNKGEDQIRDFNIRGFYTKLAFEWQPVPGAGFVTGVGPILSVSNIRGTMEIEEPVFGNYVGPFDDRWTVAYGVEPFVGVDVPVSKGAGFRFLIRQNVSMSNGRVHTYYYPGVGYVNRDKSILLSFGVGIQLWFKVKK